MSISREVFDNAVRELREIVNTQIEMVLLKTFHESGIVIEGQSSKKSSKPEVQSISKVADKVMKSMTSSPGPSKSSETKNSKSVEKQDEQLTETKKTKAVEKQSRGTKQEAAAKKKCPRVMKTGEVCDKGAAYEVDNVFYCKRCADVLNNAKTKDQLKNLSEKKVAATSSKAQEKKASSSSSTSGDAFGNLISGILGKSAERPKQISVSRKKLKDGTVIRIDESDYVWDTDGTTQLVVGKLVDGKVVTLFDDEDHKYITRHKITLSDVVQYLKEKIEEAESSGSENDNLQTSDDDLVISDSDDD